MNAVGWDGIYVLFPEYTFNNLLLRRLDHGTFMHRERCIAKYHDRGWYEIDWDGCRVYMEHVEGVVDRVKTLHGKGVFTPILWNLH